jgi:putative membrane protein insertion efficiency factor
MEEAKPAAKPGLAARVLILGVRAYQVVLGPLLGGQCRFTPSCSFYSIEAFERHGAWRGLRLTVRRLLRCQPWGGHGHDPVP